VSSRDTETVPVLWINLERGDHRRRRMLKALAAGGWTHQRIEAIDGRDPTGRLRASPDLARFGTAFPGVRRFAETSPFRRTTRSELACLASWQRALARAADSMRDLDAETILLLEDDCGATLACPQAWPVSIDEVAAAAGDAWTAIQMAPINPTARRRLFERWRDDRRPVAEKRHVRSHGNGAVLIHRRAIERLRPHLPADPDAAPKSLRHPCLVRPVADKWLYAMLPADTVFVAAVPILTLDAADSELHPGHVDRFHRGSREMVESIWREGGWIELAEALAAWDATA
jgi:hypothetical protein